MSSSATASDTAARGPRLVLWGAGIALAVLAVVAVVLGTRPAPRLDPSTPEGAVQVYAEAVFEGDRAGARAVLHPDVVDACADVPRPIPGSSATRLAILDTAIDGDDARVEVRITESFRNGPFGGGESAYEDVFGLERVDGEWRIRYGPWQFVECPEVRP